MGQLKSKQNELKPVPPKDNWESGTVFTLYVLAHTVGLSNIWRFPFKAHQHGGGAFLIPYLLALVCIGLPIFFLQMIVGQFTSKGILSFWRAVPLFRGLGWAIFAISLLVEVYFGMIISYSLYYLAMSFTSELPWQKCRPEWLQYGCVEKDTTEQLTKRAFCDAMSSMDKTSHEDYTSLCQDGHLSMSHHSPSDIYWNYEVLNKSTGIDDGMHEIKWELLLCLIATWTVVFLTYLLGIKHLGRLTAALGLAPYVLLIILLGRNASMDGALDGVNFFVIPRWEHLQKLETWYEAAIQMLFSLGLGFAGVTSMASHNRYHNKLERQAVIIGLADSLTSLLVGFVVFTSLGAMSHRISEPISKTLDEGPGLLFVTLPHSISLMPVPPLWSVLFFLTVFIVAIDSLFTSHGAKVNAILDELPSIRFYRYGPNLVSLILVLIRFLPGIVLCSRAGIYLVGFMDYYAAIIGIPIVILVEITMMVWIYGFRRLSEDVELMLGTKPNWYWMYSWLIISPLCLIVVALLTYIDFKPLVMGEYHYPDWVHGSGLAMAIAPLTLIVIGALAQYFFFTDFFRIMKLLTKPTKFWGPKVVVNQTGPYLHMKRRTWKPRAKTPSTDEKPKPDESAPAGEIYSIEEHGQFSSKVIIVN